MKTSELKTQFFRRPAAARRLVTEAPTPARAHFVPETPADLYFPAMATVPQMARQPFERKRPLLKHLFLALTLLILLAAGFTAVAAASLLYLSDLVMPGVQVMGMDVGRLTQTEAAGLLQASASQQTIRLIQDDTIWLLPLSELGLTLDAAATAKTAHEYGRSPAAWLEMVDTGAMVVQPSWVLDTAVANTYLQSRAAELAINPTDASLFVKNGQVLVIPASDGQALDVAATVAGLAQSGADIVQRGEIDLVLKSISPAITDVSGAAEQAQALLATTITIQATDPVQDEAVSWVVGSPIWGNWLILTVDSGYPVQFSWELDAEKASRFFAERNVALGENRYLDEEIGVTAVTEAIKNQQGSIQLRIYHSPSQYIVQPGDTFAGIGRKVGIPYPWIQAANPDVGTALNVGQNITIPSPDDLLPYP
ncbi:MAG: LysM peptidoglycan-binding domain-containing protein, partial [Chloroflexi bacterium]|nr:LysM peptidoglycan-binding domain-containing protein [Chloroflexota bacterium]